MNDRRTIGTWALIFVECHAPAYQILLKLLNQNPCVNAGSMLANGEAIFCCILLLKHLWSTRTALEMRDPLLVIMVGGNKAANYMDSPHAANWED